jgi:hypothetical protein
LSIEDAVSSPLLSDEDLMEELEEEDADPVSLWLPLPGWVLLPLLLPSLPSSPPKLLVGDADGELEAERVSDGVREVLAGTTGVLTVRINRGRRAWVDVVLP